MVAPVLAPVLVLRPAKVTRLDGRNSVSFGTAAGGTAAGGTPAPPHFRSYANHLLQGAVHLAHETVFVSNHGAGPTVLAFTGFGRYVRWGRDTGWRTED